RRLCQMMGGDVTAASEPGNGSTFTVRLPFAAGRTADEPATPPGEVAMRSCILVIDDDVTARDLIADYLRQAGFTVITASGGRQGVSPDRYHAGRYNARYRRLDGSGGATRRPGACRNSDRHGDDRRRAAAWHDAGGRWVSHEAD